MAILNPGQSLRPGQTLQPNNGLYKLTMQTDGNVVLYDRNSHPLWATNTGGLITPGEFIMQTDGNLVLYSADGQARWASNTWNNPGAFLDVQDDGNLVVYKPGSGSETADNALWASGTGSVVTCASGISYIVQPGDTLFVIAERKLGDGNRWTEIKNPDGTVPNPAQLRPGQELCLPGAPPPPGSGFATIVSRESYAALFPNRNPLYTYDGLVGAAQHYPNFCNEGTPDQCKREAAAFLANISHETGELVYVEEQNPQSDYCDPSNTTYPCVPGKSYHGRGPIQLSWNYNYGACGDAIGRDLLHQPELVSADSAITFLTALWFWMTPQAPKTSCHEAIRVSGFGMTIDIINGGIECGKGAPTPQALHRIELYQRYAATLQVTPGQNLYC